MAKPTFFILLAFVALLYTNTAVAQGDYHCRGELCGDCNMKCGTMDQCTCMGYQQTCCSVEGLACDRGTVCAICSPDSFLRSDGSCTYAGPAAGMEGDVCCPSAAKDVVCSGHGTCDSEGDCTCDSGFDGSDCSTAVEDDIPETWWWGIWHK